MVSFSIYNMNNLFVSYLLLTVAALLPVIASIIFFFLDKIPKFRNLNYWVRQIIFGVVFGLLAIVGTEWGIPMNSAQVNCRDAAVLTAGLLFGCPAGIIAGIIGSVERWFAAYWGVAPATQLACSLSTLIAGFYAALLRKFLFKNNKPNIFIAFFAGFVMETFHLLMVFITNATDPTFAYRVVTACTMPMLLFNALSVAFASLIYSIAEKKNLRPKRIKNQNIATTIQISMLVVCVLVYLFSSSMIYTIQSNVCLRNTTDTISASITDMESDIFDTSNALFDDDCLDVAKKAEANPYNLQNLAKLIDACDINVVNNDGLCTYSIDPIFKNINFKTDREDTVAFTTLIGSQSDTYYFDKYKKVDGQDYSRKYIGVRTTNGFVRIGFDLSVLEEQLYPVLTYFASNRHVGSNGNLIICDSNYKTVSCPENYSRDLLETDIQKVKDYPLYETSTVIYNSAETFFMKGSCEGLYIFAVIGVEDSRMSMFMDMYLVSYLQIIAYAIVFGLVYLMIDRLVLDSFNKVTNSLKNISEGNLDFDVNVETSVEFNDLSNDINKTVDTLKNFINEANERIDKELKLAKDIQSSCLPRVVDTYKDNPYFDIHACMFTAKEVGGDFYDFYYNHTNRLNFVIADVSGKGIPASLFMMRSKQELKSLTEADLPINEVFTRSNKALCEGNDAGMFVTAWQGGIDLRNGKVDFANAGHNAPLVYRKATGKFEYLKCIKGFVLAGLDTIVYKPQEIILDEGDIIFLYTDGVTEATNKNQQLYGEDRLLKVLNSYIFDSMEDLCSRVKSDVDKFVGDAPQFDDITMVALRFIKKAK